MVEVRLKLTEEELERLADALGIPSFARESVSAAGLVRMAVKRVCDSGRILGEA